MYKIMRRELVLFEQFISTSPTISSIKTTLTISSTSIARHLPLATMKSTIIAAAITLATSVSAQNYYNITSKPFHLVLESAKNKTLNGATLFPCHEGAAIEGLCLSTSKDVSQSPLYNFNTSVYDTSAPTDIGKTGILTYNLPGGGSATYPSSLQLNVNPTTNVGVPLFFPGDDDAVELAFDKNNHMNIQGYIDDTVYPPATGKVQAYYRWYICDTQAGYAYTTLAWVYGNKGPENPTCRKVDVKRVFA